MEISKCLWRKGEIEMGLEDYRLPAEKLRWKCDPKSFAFECTDQLTPLREFIGQDRAIKAIEFGLAVEKPGYNIFVTGLTGTGKASAVKAHLEDLVSQAKMKAGDHHPDDWCYVYNLTTPDRPKALRLSQGKGKSLRDDMEKLLARIQTDIPKAFSSDDYSRAKQEITQEGQTKHRQFFQDLEKQAQEEGFSLQASPVGLLLLPMIQDKPATPEEFMALKKEERDALESKREALMKRVESTIQAGQALEKETADKVRLLDEKVAEIALVPLFQELLSAYQGLPDV
ncbi:MAG: AAA family ATPase, partial [Chloroflexota bacterium]|nr:AAA family ATPase [Chloroflexota bacterium]